MHEDTNEGHKRLWRSIIKWNLICLYMVQLSENSGGRNCRGSRLLKAGKDDPQGILTFYVQSFVERTARRVLSCYGYFYNNYWWLTNQRYCIQEQIYEYPRVCCYWVGWVYWTRYSYLSRLTENYYHVSIHPVFHPLIIGNYFNLCNETDNNNMMQHSELALEKICDT